MKLSACVEEFLSALVIEQGRSERTRRAYGYDLAMFARHVGDLDAGEVTTFHVRSFLRELHGRGYGARALARKVACLRSFFKFLADNGVVRVDPTRSVKSPRLGNNRRLPKHLTESEVRNLFAKLDRQSWNSRLRVVVRLLYATMIRVSELVRLTVGDVDFEAGVVRVLGKGDKERLVPVDPGTLEVVAEYLATEWGVDARDPKSRNWPLLPSRGGGHLSPRTIQRDVSRLAARVPSLSGKKVTPHTFRHTGATHLRNRGMDLSELQDLLGHASPATTRIYARNDVRRLRASYLEKHPLHVSGLDDARP
ncbi:MAG: tyrosine recombinase XerC [Promethearchaeota archaeon]